MALSVGKIAKLAADGVSGAVSDVIGPATLTFITQGSYNSATRSHIDFPTTISGRASIGTSKAIKSVFPAFISGPDDVLMSLFGFTQVPKVGWTIRFKDVDREIKAVGDIAGVGQFFEVVAG